MDCTRNLPCFHTRRGDVIELWGGGVREVFVTQEMNVDRCLECSAKALWKIGIPGLFSVHKFLHPHRRDFSHVLITETMQWNLKINWNVQEIDEKSDALAFLQDKLLQPPTEFSTLRASPLTRLSSTALLSVINAQKLLPPRPNSFSKHKELEFWLRHLWY